MKLITTAIREMTRDPKVGRAEALRRSMLALIDKGEPHEAHPAYWAPFVVVGEGGAVNAGGSPPNNVVPNPARKIVRKPVRKPRIGNGLVAVELVNLSSRAAPRWQRSQEIATWKFERSVVAV